MSEPTLQREFLERLESYIENFDQIFLILCKRDILEELLWRLNDFKAVKHMEKKILLLATERNRWNFEPGITYCQMGEKEAWALYRLYCLYEFSDRFQVISETDNCGSLFNFVRSGILRMDEVWEALLH